MGRRFQRKPEGAESLQGQPSPVLPRQEAASGHPQPPSVGSLKPRPQEGHRSPFREDGASCAATFSSLSIQAGSTPVNGSSLRTSLTPAEALHGAFPAFLIFCSKPEAQRPGQEVGRADLRAHPVSPPLPGPLARGGVSWVQLWDPLPGDPSGSLTI